MKKRFMLMALMCLAVAGALLLPTCGGSSSSSDETTGDSAKTEATSEESTDTAQEAAPAEQAQSKYGITIDGAEVGEDYKGAPVIIVTYTFTNNSDEDIAAYVAISDKAFQNGIELSSAHVVDGVDSEGWDADIKPGVSVTYQRAYELSDQSDVTVECSELISFDDVILATSTFSVA